MGPRQSVAQLPLGKTHKLDIKSSFQSILRPVATIFPSPTYRTLVQAAASCIMKQVPIRPAIQTASKSIRFPVFIIFSPSIRQTAAQDRQLHEKYSLPSFICIMKENRISSFTRIKKTHQMLQTMNRHTDCYNILLFGDCVSPLFTE